MDTGIQVSPHMCDKGTQYVAPEETDSERNKGTMCKMSDEERAREQEEQEMMEIEADEENREEEDTSPDKKKPASSDYMPDTTESSSDYESTPQKPRKKLCKS